ncbi:recombinase family protein [Cysteiniphilum sp. JM-1]|uniref:recombinase family protein n=1 Tax=Cysteiniphilum sp. JM-1 TaxID=2610891 RepID=UPI001CD0E8F3|nr:recombinase family protein [Cysteiniphilum sp. JM-1]
MTMKKAYARISTTAQNIDSQLDELKNYGYDEIYIDEASGKDTSRPQLNELLKSLRKGDQIIIYRLDRLGRSIQHLIELMTIFDKKGVALVSLSESINTTTATGKLVFNLFAAIADFERNLIIERTQIGLKAAKARGRTGGRKKGLSNEAKDKAEIAYNLYQTELAKDSKNSKNKRSVEKLADIIGVSRKTFYNYVKWYADNKMI